jgi:hypothetical protein
LRFPSERACQQREEAEEMSMKSGAKTRIARREFLRTLGVGAVAGAASPLVTGARADTENNDEKRKPRYKETEHVKTFYRVNKYPG